MRIIKFGVGQEQKLTCGGCFAELGYWLADIETKRVYDHANRDWRYMGHDVSYVRCPLCGEHNEILEDK